MRRPFARSQKFSVSVDPCARTAYRFVAHKSTNLKLPNYLLSIFYRAIRVPGGKWLNYNDSLKGRSCALWNLADILWKYFHRPGQGPPSRRAGRASWNNKAFFTRRHQGPGRNVALHLKNSHYWLWGYPPRLGFHIRGPSREPSRGRAISRRPRAARRRRGRPSRACGFQEGSPRTA